MSDSNDRVELSIVIPCYNEEGNLAILFQRLQAVLAGLDLSYEIICVNDGSRDDTLAKLIDFHLHDDTIKVVNLSRNFGKEIALTAGLDYTRGKAVIPIDADLQDPPELIADLVQKWREGYDVVYATRRSRQGEGWLKKMTATAFYRTLGNLSPVAIPRNTGDFRLLDRRVIEAIKKMPERTRFMKGMFAWVGYNQTAILFDRDPRLMGKTTWNYWKLWNFALDGITSFSMLPLKVWSYLGVIISFISLLYASFLVLRTIVLGIDVPGYASIMVAVLFFGGIQLITLGILGEYLGRVYEEVKGRPLYFVRDAYGFERNLRSQNGTRQTKADF
ncbi:MAG: glycosyltransferase family 2 protein [Cyanobacteria bacterium P01_E01_bin.42]